MSNNGHTRCNVLWYNQLGMHDVDRVGGKNASLGEMITHLSELGVSVPNGFATTAQALTTFWSKVVSTNGFINYWIIPILTISQNYPKRALRSVNGLLRRRSIQSSNNQL